MGGAREIRFEDAFGELCRLATLRHGWVDYPAEGIWQTTDATRWKQLGT